MRLPLLFFATCLAVPIVARAEVNVVTQVTTRQEGGKTIVTVRGSATPSFTAYRLERPSRLVVDVAGGRFKDAGDGPIDVDTWAVGQIVTAQYQDDVTRTARVMIGLKRAASYDVKARDKDVIVVITPDEAMPAVAPVQAQTAEWKAERQKVEREQLELAMKTDKLRAEARVAEEARQKALREAQAEDARRSLAQAGAKRAEAEAQARAEMLRKQAEEARASAEQARAELEKLSAARKAEQDRLKSEQGKNEAARKLEQQKLDELRIKEQQKIEAARRSELERIENTRKAERERLDATRKAEELRLVAMRKDEEQKLAQLRAEAARSGQKGAEEVKRTADEARRARAEAERAQAEARKSTEEARRVQEEAQRAQAELKRARAEAREAHATAEKAQAELKWAQAEAQRRAIEENKHAAELQKSVAEARKNAEELQRSAAEAQRAAAEAKKGTAEAQRLQAEAQRLAAEASRSAAEIRKSTEEAQRQQAEAQRRALEANRNAAEIQKSAAEAQRQQAEARKNAEELQRSAAEAQRAAAEAKKGTAEAQRLQAEAQRLAAEASRSAAELQKSTAEAQRQQTEARKSAAESEARAVQVRAEAEREQKRLEGLRAEAEKIAKLRDEEAKKLVDTQAQARRASNERAAKLEEARIAAEKRARASEAAQAAEERKMQAQAAEAERLAQAARKLDETEDARRVAEAKANKAAEVARTELARIESLRAESRRLQTEADRARTEVNRQRAEGERLVAMQEVERARLMRERDEARKTAERRAEEAARANRSSLVASQSMSKIEQAEREARRIAEERTRESLKLEAARREAQALAEKRSEELRKLDAARAHAQKTLQERDAELTALAEKRKAEESRLAAAQETLAAQLRDQSKLKSENAALADKMAKVRGEIVKMESEARARLAVVPAPSKVREALPVEKLQPRSVKVNDVRFDDDGESSRVVLQMGGEVRYTVLRATPRTAVLRLAGAELPKKLERTIDVSAYQGPIKSVSTYSDPDDPSAVRVVVNLESDQAEPKMEKDGHQLSWAFKRPQARSYPPQKVGAFGNSLPLQPAAASPANTPTSLAQAAGPGRRRKVYSGRRISLDFKDIDIHNVLRLLADVGQVNIVTSDDVKGSVTIRMVDVPWDQALDVILKAKGMGLQREGNLIRVAPAAVLEKELEAEIARAKAAVELKPIDTRLIPLSYAHANNMRERVQDVLSPRGKVSIDERTNMLIVSDVAGNIALAEDLVRNLDTQTPQVLIEARVVEARSNFLRTIGIQWGGNSFNSAATGNATGIAFPSTVGVAGGATDAVTNVQGIQGPQAASPNYVVNLPAAVGTGSGGALGLTLGSVNGAININLRLSSLENTGEVRIISAPKITTLDNVEASIEQGVAIPISVVSAAGTNTVFVDAKLNLTVKPHVTNEGSVVMQVNITRNEPDFVNVGARGDPTILKKQAKTEMLVRDGDTAVIGGIYTRNTGLAYNKVPWFADIPVIGWLFKNRRENDDRSEMLIFITPRVVNRAVVRR